MAAFIIGGITLSCPPTSEAYQVDYRIVAGREATALSGGPLELGVIRKKFWTLTFFSGDDLDALLALLGTTTTFQDHDGKTYPVKIVGEPQAAQYPLSEMGLLNITLREV